MCRSGSQLVDLWSRPLARARCAASRAAPFDLIALADLDALTVNVIGSAAARARRVTILRRERAKKRGIDLVGLDDPLTELGLQRRADETTDPAAEPHRNRRVQAFIDHRRLQPTDVE